MKHFGILVALLLAATAGHAQLIINELSQGPATTQEYVELLVTGTPSCGGSNTVDIRGWIIDDNNSWHATGSGSGIAGGHARFDSIAQWASVKIGTIILIYNDADVSASVQALTDDVNDANGDCVYIIPVSSSVIKKNTTLPGNNGTMTSYATASSNYSSTGTWVILGMANGGDAFHTVSPALKTRAYHAIGWGNNNDSINVYYPGSQSGKVIYMANTVDNNPFNAANYIDSAAATQETPGAPNNAANANWIRSMNNNCQPFTTPTLSFNTPGQITCSNTSTVIIATSNTNNAVYTWSNGVTGPNDTVSAGGTYYVTVTNAAGSCSVTDSIVITSNSSLSITASATNTGCGAGTGTASVSLTSGTATGYLWSNTQTTSSISGLTAGTYSVTVSSSGCSATASVDVVNTGTLDIATSATNTTCGASNGTASVSVLNGGTATAYSWSTNGTTASINNLTPGTYYVTVTGNGGCTAVDSVVVTASNNSSVTISSDVTTICARDSAIICAPDGSASYLWNTGASTSCITVKAAGAYYVTVTENGGCTALSNRVDIAVYPSPPVSISVKGDTLSAYNALSYQWYLNNNPIQGATNNIYIATQPGNYQVQVTDTNSCSSFSNAVVVTGLNDISAEDMVVYPNPLSGGNWMLNATPALIGTTIRIYNNEGQIVYQSEIRSQQMEIEAELARGVYFLKINSGQSSFTRKLIKL